MSAAAAAAATATPPKKPYMKVAKIHTNKFTHAATASAALKFRVIPVATLEDNYAYIIIDPKSGAIAVVDPAEPDKLQTVLKREGLDQSKISHVLVTHHHWDHSQGNEGMVSLLTPPGTVTVVGGEADPVPAVTKKVKHGDTFQIGTGLNVSVIHTPCHTRGHVLFCVSLVSAAAAGGSGSGSGDGKTTDSKTGAAATPSTPPSALFTGDTLFTGGCGRFFEGVASEMLSNMYDRISTPLRGDTLIFSGHEYSSSNLRFAVHCEPDNKAASDKHVWALAQDELDECTQPSTLDEERSYNPFMRVHLPALQKLTGKTDRVDVMDALRNLKNNFK